MALARADGVHLLLADRLSLPEVAVELRDAAVVEALRARELRDVLDALAGSGIRAILIKGAALAYTHYQRPELRPRSDTDLMIPVAARGEAAEVFVGLGYERAHEIDGDVAIGQSHYVKVDRYGLSHALDVHWRVSNVRAFADLLSYDELSRDAADVPALGPHAFCASPVHALFVACLHRVAHHGDARNLLWLYDVTLIARAMTPAERTAFRRLASARRAVAVCARTLTLAQDAFGGLDQAWIESLRPDDEAREPTAAFVGGGLRQIDILRSDLEATRWSSRLQLVREHLFPPAAYMRHRFPRWPTVLLPLAYLCRIVLGAPRWLRR